MKPSSQQQQRVRLELAKLAEDLQAVECAATCLHVTLDGARSTLDQCLQSRSDALAMHRYVQSLESTVKAFRQVLDDANASWAAQRSEG